MTKESDIFKGVAVYFQGYTDLSIIQLKQMIVENGGEIRQVFILLSNWVVVIIFQRERRHMLLEEICQVIVG